MAYELDWAASRAEMSPPLGRRRARSFMGVPSPARLYDLINACSADRSGQVSACLCSSHAPCCRPGVRGNPPVCTKTMPALHSLAIMTA